MFTHYYRYKTKYLADVITADERLEIVYPTDEHAMITTGHDFYVIGAFHGIEVKNDAELKIELKSLESETIVRTVFTKVKDNRAGMFVDYEGIETAEDKETVRCCGMPDLVYDPKHPESFWYTWNKAYYTDTVFSALIYGGTCTLGNICPYDQYGKLLEPLREGYYELRVTLQNGEEKITSAKTLWLTEGKKEIILSRFSPDAHVKCVQQFVKEEGFEEFIDPYAGIWDTQFFSFEWPVKAWVEIPARWHFGDAQEYESGIVHFFNYNISEACISWKTEIGTMLKKDKNCVKKSDRLQIYYYKEGHPKLPGSGNALDSMALMGEEQYLGITKKRLYPDGCDGVLQVEGVCKPLPAEVEPISACAYSVKNMVAFLDYWFYEREAEQPFFVSDNHPTGVIRKKEDAPDEFLVLHTEHEIRITGLKKRQSVRMRIQVKDLYGTVIETQEHEIG